MDVVRRTIANQIRQLVGASGTEPALDLSRGDPGFFGPASVCWRVHGDFTTMMIGGVAALLLQMLHPGALAGVWDHSNFQADMAGRLRRTARFIAGTTYGSTDQALALIARVQAVHDQVHGETPDGRPYSAHDPDLLTWVHVAEVSMFLAAYRRYRDLPLTAIEQDRYFAETATIARRLGATGVPDTRRAAEAYLLAMRPHLRSDARTRAVADALLRQRGPSPAFAPVAPVFFRAARDLLPDWAAAMHGHPAAGLRGPVGLSVRGLGAVLRWSLPDGAEARARRRTASSAPAEGSPIPIL
jgi:uncharacterized protein (DUF2236 family)